MTHVHIGTSGFYYAHWMKDFYPVGIKKDALLTYYQTKFPTVEINSSFYHIPRATTIENWRSTVDDNFIFTFKASKIITHLKKFNVDKTIIDSVFSPLQVFANKTPKHLILFQTPANLHGHIDKLELLFSLLPETFLYAFEFRHETWFTNDIYDLLKKYNATVVLSDSVIKSSGERTWPLHDIDTASFSYIRFHGSKKMYASSYTDEELQSYADLIKDKRKKGLDVYCYFNNDIEGYAVKNAKQLQSLL